jgi:hypothetical protein
VTGTLRGAWGFHSFDGPRYRLHTAKPAQWIVASKDASVLIVGREDTLHLQSADACCVSGVKVHDEQGKPLETEWKTTKPDELEVKVPLQKASSGSVTMVIKKFGLHEGDEITLHTYAEAGWLDSFSIHSGDANGILKGTRLDLVDSLEVNGLRFAPQSLSRAHQQDELKVAAQDASAGTKLHPGDSIVVHVTLKDTRVLDLKTEVESQRPIVSILNKSVQLDQSTSSPVVHFGSPDELPQDGRLNFFLKTQVPETFPATEKIEVATADESYRAQLNFKTAALRCRIRKRSLRCSIP